MIFLTAEEEISSTEAFEMRKRGKVRELMFLHAWRAELRTSLWFRSVREASWNEDRFEHIDAFLMLPNGREIAVQIKGTYDSACAFKEKWEAEKRGIVVVIIGDDYSNEEIIFSTLHSLESAWKKLRIDGELVHQFKVWRFLESWRAIESAPDWFKRVREATIEEKVALGCDAYLQRADDFEWPVHVIHTIKSVHSIKRFELKSGIPRIAVLITGPSNKEAIQETTRSAIEAMKMRHDDLIARQLRRKMAQ